ncbi:MAG: hypothetical protein K2F94_05405 [Muribaculaceae bacterium]|nr:hypothetical protein [Muribaculaceae bacterium]MDE6533533.1 hypothetical protein [Muribaculaceae bacterium]
MKRLLLIVFIVFALQVEAQTVVYAYNQNGGCISRVLRITESKKSPGKVNKDEMLDEITSRVYFSKDTDNITIVVSTTNNDPKLSFALSDISGVVRKRGPLKTGENSLYWGDLKKNIYLLTLYGDNYAESYKLIKE